jgi:hypothetical protein
MNERHRMERRIKAAMEEDDRMFDVMCAEILREGRQPTDFEHNADGLARMYRFERIMSGAIL